MGGDISLFFDILSVCSLHFIRILEINRALLCHSFPKFGPLSCKFVTPRPPTTLLCPDMLPLLHEPPPYPSRSYMNLFSCATPLIAFNTYVPVELMLDNGIRI